MDAVFVTHVDALRPKLQHLLAMEPLKPTALSRTMPPAGIYLLSEAGRHLYVGRSNSLRHRIALHCRSGATHRTAAFAFRLARETTGNVVPTYQ